MKILAIDTATENCSAALLIDGRLLSREQRLERGHAERILAMIDEVLSEGGAPLRALQAIAFGRGPGAFTGVRLAASITQGLAFGADLPVVPMSDLRALAQRALEMEQSFTRVLVCADARMREVYWGCFERSPAALAVAVGDERVGPPERVQLPAGWGRQGRALAASGLCAAGSGFAAYADQLAAVAAASDAVLAQLLPRAQEIARLAAPEVTAGRIVKPDQALPVYLRDDIVSVTPAQSLN